MITRTCKQCGKQFEIEDGEIKFFRDKNLSLPKRCRECRKLNNGSTGSGHNKQKSGIINGISGKNKLRFGFIGICLIIWLVFYLGFLNQDSGYPVSKETAPEIRNENAVSKETDPGIQNEDNVSKETGWEAGNENAVSYEFRNAEYLQEHYDKHGAEFGYTSPEEYLEGANKVICAEDVLHKLEAEDGDGVYYLERTNEFVIISTDGYIRTYFKPEDGIEYYNRQ